ncbi:phage minor head protein [Natrononativus amylolyticus]|uniref:phage minor head protein n=1 Tax=Natrononativus amylolyticus TaxID=2963434 RepID=UPI0020CE6E59|nr:phage minor head protein [Natrononativus amylolyticus]
MDEFGDALDSPQRDLVEQVRSGNVDLSQLQSVRADVEAAFGRYTSDIMAVYEAGLEEGAQLGREIAARRHQLDVTLDVVPDHTLEALEEWAIESTNEVVATMSDEVSRVLRSAHQDGDSIEEIATMLNTEVFEGRLKGTKAEEVAQTEMIASSNRGSHSAFQEADGVVAERWVSAMDGNQRDSHGAVHDQIVSVDSTFRLPGNIYMEYPGDKSAPVEEFVRCRCSIQPVFADSLTETQLEAIMDGKRISLSE